MTINRGELKIEVHTRFSWWLRLGLWGIPIVKHIPVVRTIYLHVFRWLAPNGVWLKVCNRPWTRCG